MPIFHWEFVSQFFSVDDNLPAGTEYWSDKSNLIESPLFAMKMNLQKHLISFQSYHNSNNSQ